MKLVKKYNSKKMKFNNGTHITSEEKIFWKYEKELFFLFSTNKEKQNSQLNRQKPLVWHTCYIELKFWNN